MPTATAAAPQYILVIKSDRIAHGPFDSREDAEYMAMEIYGTAVTGASMREDFLIVELRSGGDAPARQRAAHVAALLLTDA